jgi:hypothetical protein
LPILPAPVAVIPSRVRAAIRPAAAQSARSSAGRNLARLRTLPTAPKNPVEQEQRLREGEPGGRRGERRGRLSKQFDSFLLLCLFCGGAICEVSPVRGVPAGTDPRR